MTQDIENSIHYIADDGNGFYRKRDNFFIGKNIYIGIHDSIENYKENVLSESDSKFLDNFYCISTKNNGQEGLEDKKDE